jgi:fused signal recognition particle receptor
MGVLGRISQGLSRTKRQIVERFEAIVRAADEGERRARPLEPDTIEALEELLIEADVGPSATSRIVAGIRGRSRGGESLRDLVKAEIRGVFAAVTVPAAPRGDAGAPRVMLVVGVNGTGKTTTVGKLAHLFKSEGRQPLVCAADTFRAAAVEQLEIWARRAQVDLVRAHEGSDPAAVVYDAIAAARARRLDPVIVDTAGRLHTRVNLMQELEKICRVAGREVAGAPHDVLLVIDATVGQNGVAQARQFTQASGVTGVVLTKLDGTAKGGVAVSIASDLRLPVCYVGVGEAIDDLVAFSPGEYAEGLFADRW